MSDTKYTDRAISASALSELDELARIGAVTRHTPREAHEHVGRLANRIKDYIESTESALTAARERIAELEGELSDIPRIVATVTDLERDLAAARADAARLREALEAIKRHVEISSPSMAPYSTVHHIATAALSSAATGGEGEG